MNFAFKAALLAGAAPLNVSGSRAQRFGGTYFLGENLTDRRVLELPTQNKNPNRIYIFSIIDCIYIVFSKYSTKIIDYVRKYLGISSIINVLAGVPARGLSQAARFRASGLAFGPRDITGISKG